MIATSNSSSQQEERDAHLHAGAKAFRVAEYQHKRQRR